MKGLLSYLLPTTLPNRSRHVVGWCFAATIPLTVVVVMVIRLGWRRGKGLYDL